MHVTFNVFVVHVQPSVQLLDVKSLCSTFCRFQHGTNIKPEVITVVQEGLKRIDPRSCVTFAICNIYLLFYDI